MHSLSRERGATLLDAVVGTGLMLVVFVGIVGAFRLTVQAVGNNSARAGAIALANERLEYIRSLPYDSIGTVGGIPAGALAQEENVVLNNITYTRRTFVGYEDDPGDGVGAADSNNIVTDYKAVKTDVSWLSRQGTRTITMVARLSPPGVETAVPGGTLVIEVTDAAAAPVSNVAVRIVNESTNPQIDMTTFTDANGLATVLGAPPGANYEITVTKSGYSTAQTYDADVVNTNPIPAHLAVALNQTTLSTFQIDLLSSLTVQTFEPVEESEWDDVFINASQLSQVNGVEVFGGSLVLTNVEGAFGEEGTGVSVSIAPQYLFGWNEFAWDDSRPAGTDIRYHVYTDAGVLVPDSALAGNSAGFSTSPVSLAGLATTTYPALRVGALLQSSDPEKTPSVNSWRVTYDVGPTPLPNATFTMRGAKTVGSGPGGPVYKYDVNHSSGGNGSITIGAVEYDTYTLSVPVSSGYDISSSCAPQPTVVVPNSSVTSQLFLSPHTANSLLVDVRAAGGAVIPGASVRLQRQSYDTTIATDSCGQSFFSGIAASAGTPYTITVTAPGYQNYTNTELEVTGTVRLSVILNN
ncbi:MAG TPA: carboxypeptidase-like regulatory domain-containing protein [Candidatus Paceibacterota bacterium]|nr:carboxypeptidase-like regulatory domain-containing protein [Candidatus Paceibacterota bacterium]